VVDHDEMDNTVERLLCERGHRGPDHACLVPRRDKDDDTAPGGRRDNRDARSPNAPKPAPPDQEVYPDQNGNGRDAVQTHEQRAWAHCRPRYSTLRRHHLPTDFAAGVSLRVEVDVPFSGAEVVRLLWCERRLSLDGIFGGAVFLREPDLRLCVLALDGRPVEVRHGYRS